MSTLCSQCKTNIIEGLPYREAQMLDKPLNAPIKMPWLTPARKAIVKKATILLSIALTISIVLSAGILFLPNVMAMLGIGIGMVAACVAAFFLVGIFPHKLGVAIARKCKWKSWFHCRDINMGYDHGNCGPVAWLLGAGVMGGLPVLYGLGCLGAHLFK